MSISRRYFLLALGLSGFVKRKPQIMTIDGLINPSEMGVTLIHEHFLVDFIGADKINFDRWDKAKVAEKVLPYLSEVKALGVKTIFDCTPAFLGRDIHLLKLLSQQSVCFIGY